MDTELRGRTVIVIGAGLAGLTAARVGKRVARTTISLVV